MFADSSGPFGFTGTLPAGDYSILFTVTTQADSAPNGPAAMTDLSSSVVGTLVVPEPVGLATLIAPAALLVRRRRTGNFVYNRATR
jgi:hypothetical protein